MAEKFGIQVEGLSKLAKDLDRFAADTAKELPRRIQGEAAPLTGVARSAQASHTLTGSLARSFLVRKRKARAGVGSNLPYAASQAFGGAVGRGGATVLGSSQVSGWFGIVYDRGKRDVPPAIDRWLTQTARSV